MPPGREAEAVHGERLVRLLIALFSSTKRFLITNESMLRLLEVYGKELLSAQRDGQAHALLISWQSDVSAFQRQWLQAGREDELTFQGAVMPVVTERATDEASQYCKKRKRKGPASAPRRRTSSAKPRRRPTTVRTRK